MRVLLGVLMLLCWNSPAQAASTTAFYYGPRVPRELLEVYDQVVVQPDQVAAKEFANTHANAVAYISIGEVARSSQEASNLDKSWIVAENDSWSSLVMDVASVGYQKYVLDKFERLWNQGFHAFFLDTLDSYQLGARSAADRDHAVSGLCYLLMEAAKRHPGIQLLVNRGFELLPEVASVVQKVVVESLFDRWNAAQSRYESVPATERRWLMERLQEVQTRYGLPIVVIDYRPFAERTEARRTAARIAALNFEPWVTNAELNSMAVGSLEVLPRRVAVLTNQPLTDGPSEGERFIGPVLEHLGYVATYYNVRDRLPGNELVHSRGIISWLTSPRVAPGYAAWLSKRSQAGIKFVVFGNPGFALDGHFAEQLGIEIRHPTSSRQTHVVRRNELIGFEAPPPPRPFDCPLLAFDSPDGAVHLELADSMGRQGAVIFSGQFGGMALSHALAVRGLHGRRSWVVDPVEFLRQALQLPQVPVPDTTTENGRRIGVFLLRRRGLSWPARFAGNPLIFDILREQLLDEFGFPHSVVTGSGPPSEAPGSEADHLLANRLTERADVVPIEQVMAGSSYVAASGPSMTQLQASKISGVPRGALAPDLFYLPSSTDEAYSFSQLLRTLKGTDLPRRTKPVYLDYHAYLASSPGGLATLKSLYRWASEQPIYALTVEQYQERLKGFEQQVLARHLDGSVSFIGGEQPLTVRLDSFRARPQLEQSQGVAVARTIGATSYVTFLPGAQRRLQWGPVQAETTHLSQASGTVRKVHSHATPSGVELTFEVDSGRSLDVDFAGLPPGARCELTWNGHIWSGRSDALGHLEYQGSRASSVVHALKCPVEPILAQSENSP